MLARRAITPVLSFLVLLSAPCAVAQVSLTALGSSHTQNFNTLASSSTSSTVPTGWVFSESGTNANTLYTAGTGSSNAGDTYSFGATSNSERAFGQVRSGSLISTIGASFTNNTGGTITSLAISYTGEQWRFGGVHSTNPERYDFQYSTTATALTTGTYTNVDSLDFNPPVTSGTAGALDGNNAANRTAISFTITGLSIGPGSTFWIRWSDADASGADDGLAIDDLSVTPQGVATPVLNISDVTVAEGDPPGTTTFTFAVTLSSAAAGAVTFNIATADGTTNAATTADNDYVTNSVSGASIASGTGPYEFSVIVNRDLNVESDETFLVNVTGISGAAPGDTQGVGTITNDDIAFAFVHEVQGSGSSTPISGTTVKVEGVVTADYQATAELRGFFIQEEDSDADGSSLTSEGIFVFCSSCPTAVAEGERVRVTGSVSEFFDMTQLTASTAGSVVVLEAGNHLADVTPVSVDLPIVGDVNAFYEAIEGMLVTFTDTLSVSEYFELFRYGHVQLYEGGRPRQFTEDNAPSTAGYPSHVAALSRRKVILDDANNGENNPLSLADGSQYVYHPRANGGFSIGTQGPDFFRGGDTVTGLTGVLHWSFAGGSSANSWRVRPNSLTASSFTVQNPRPATPPVVSGSIRVASVNMLNYFTTLDTTSSSSSGPCGPAGTQDCRGADSTAELNRQRERASIVLCTLNPDVAGLMEMENTNLNAITDLLGAVNARCGGANPYTYAATPGTSLGTDAIRVFIIYRSATLTPVGSAVFDSNAVHDRPPTAQTFRVSDPSNQAYDEVFTVVANHFKSKGCGGTGADADQGDGQGCYNARRTSQAQRLLAWIGELNLSDPDVVLVGDFNAYAKEDPITTIVAAGYTDTESAFLGSAAYSYLFDGQLGHLDYALTSATLTGKVTGVGAWHINADEVPLFDYNDEVKDTGEATFEEKPNGSSLSPARTMFQAASPYRASDHDPVLIGLFPVADLAISKDAANEVLPGAELEYSITVSNDGPDTALNVEWTDTLPSGTTFVSLDEAEGWDCTTPLSGAGGTITCSARTLSIGNAVFTLTVDVGAGVAGGTVLSNTATLTSDSSDLTDDSAQTTVEMTADVGIAKSASPDPVIAGTALTYTITASNDGPDPAEDVSWSDALPLRTIFLSLDAPSGWTCSTPSVGSTGTVSCSKASLGVADAVFTVTVGVSPTAVPGDVISNTASISSDTADLWPGNEDDTATAVVGIRMFNAGFDVYNQGRGTSTASQVRAWLSDRAVAGGFELGDGYDDEIPVEIAVPAGGCTAGNCTPALTPGASTPYTAGFVAPASFGRLEKNVADPNSALSNGDGSFTVESSSGSTGRVGFLFERYLWVDADTGDVAGQALPVLKANDAQAVKVAVQAPRFSQLSHLSATFNCLTGGSGNGTPRLEVHFEDHGTLRIRLGDNGAFSEPCETLDAFSGQNVIGDDTEGRYDTSGLTGVAGPLSPWTEYEDALGVAGSLVITRIDFVASDSGAGGRSYKLYSIDVAPPTD